MTQKRTPQSLQFAQLSKLAAEPLENGSSLEGAAAELIPIRNEGRTFAVIELLGKHHWSCDERVVNELTLLGLELGRSVDKKFAH